MSKFYLETTKYKAYTTKTNGLIRLANHASDETELCEFLPADIPQVCVALFQEAGFSDEQSRRFFDED